VKYTAFEALFQDSVTMFLQAEDPNYFTDIWSLLSTEVPLASQYTAAKDRIRENFTR